MDLQKFGVDIYLIQVIFGAVDIPAKIVITVCMSVLGRRPSQSGALIIAGISILANLLVPPGMLGNGQLIAEYSNQETSEIWKNVNWCLTSDKQTIRTCLAVLGKGCLAASFNCCYLYSGELYPTVIR